MANSMHSNEWILLILTDQIHEWLQITAMDELTWIRIRSTSELWRSRSSKVERRTISWRRWPNAVSPRPATRSLLAMLLLMIILRRRRPGWTRLRRGRRSCSLRRRVGSSRSRHIPFSVIQKLPERFFRVSPSIISRPILWTTDSRVSDSASSLCLPRQRLGFTPVLLSP